MNNLRLYKICKKDIIEAVDYPDASECEGSKVIVRKIFRRKYSGYFLKIIYEKKKGEIIVITAYPVKEERWR